MKKLKKLDWSKYISVDNTIAVNASVYSDFFNHSHYVALKVKDAIVDYFRDLTKGRRPDVNTKNPDVRINIHISNDKCTISLIAQEIHCTKGDTDMLLIRLQLAKF